MRVSLSRVILGEAITDALSMCLELDEGVAQSKAGRKHCYERNSV